MSAEKLKEEIIAAMYCDGELMRDDDAVDAILAAIRREVEKVPIVERVGNIHGTTPDERINRADVLAIFKERP